jgi:hypothetical protein
VFEDYLTKGSLAVKEIVCHALDLLLGKDKTLTAALPAQGIATLMHQEKESRFVNHLIYAAPVKRGANTEIIEDIVPLYDIEVALRLPRRVTNVYLAPQMESLPFALKDGIVSYKVPRLECHQMVVLDYDGTVPAYAAPNAAEWR